MKLLTTAKVTGYVFLLLLVRKIMIAFIAMGTVTLNRDEVSYETMISDISFESVIRSLPSNKETYILILNKHALNMTMNWLCNTHLMTGCVYIRTDVEVHNNTLIVTLDEDSSTILRDLWPQVHQLKWIVPSLKDTFWADSLSVINLSTREEDIIFDRGSDGGPLIAGKRELEDTTRNVDIFHWKFLPIYRVKLILQGVISVCALLLIRKLILISYPEIFLGALDKRWGVSSLITNWQWCDSVLLDIPPTFIQFDGEAQLGGKLAKVRLSEKFGGEKKEETAREALHSNAFKKREVASYSHQQFRFYQNVIRYLKNQANRPEKRIASCLACTAIVDGVQAMLSLNKTDQEVADFVTRTCNLLNVEQPHVCKNIVDAFTFELAFVLRRALFTSNEFCGAFIQDCGQSEFPLTVMWNLTMPGNKPPIKPWPIIPVTRVSRSFQDNKPTYRVLHLSDIHIDRQYAVGTEAYCQLDDLIGTYAMCCRNYDDETSVGRKNKKKPIYVPAGKWGMPYACDLPYETFESALKHISKNHTDLDYIIITGDFEAHDSWDYTETLTKENMQNMTNVLLKYFPNTPVYIAIGNHEGVPQDAMAPHTMPEYDQRGPQWLYSIMKNMWSKWIPNSALPDVQYRASYAVYPKPGLKLISINTIYCSEFNFYLYIDQVDPDATLQWLIDELMDSEQKGDKVHIISHIPPGDNYCLKGWSHNFFEIIKRQFENTVAQQFYGHTHYDHFQVYYDIDHPDRRPFHFNWIAPSITTYDWLHPSYRIYTIDGGYKGATYLVKDAETYYGNVTEANLYDHEPIWRFEYSTKRCVPKGYYDMIKSNCRRNIA
uniref:Sphingomyelin phosphodiesterase n=1 Tax=Heterorhabditis bacteriophora TaxID=37862 RepID=A0A1I7X6J4_HETBA